MHQVACILIMIAGYLGIEEVPSHLQLSYRLGSDCSVKWTICAFHIIGLEQERCYSIANEMELSLSCTNPLICNAIFITATAWEVRRIATRFIFQWWAHIFTSKNLIHHNRILKVAWQWHLWDNRLEVKNSQKNTQYIFFLVSYEFYFAIINYLILSQLNVLMLTACHL